MAGLKVKDETGLGRLIIRAAADTEVREQLLKDPKRILREFVEDLPEDHAIVVLTETEQLTFLVIPPKESIPYDTNQMELLLREEARDYDKARNKVERAKGGDGIPRERSIPSEIVEETYALMIGHTALGRFASPRRRSRSAGE